MYKAKQDALIQETNQGLISIRQTEISYHVNVNMAFGTQAALIGGFTYGKVLIDFESDRYFAHHMQTAYWVCGSITVASAVLVIVLTMLIQVLAPGLALNGPIGSMARATEGMKAEQGTVRKVFSLMMISFTVATVLAAWTVMDDYAAVASSAVFLIASFMGYYYTMRIYARFYWDESETSRWDDSSEEPKKILNRELRVDSEALDDKIHCDAVDRMHKQNSVNPLHTHSTLQSTTTSRENNKRQGSKFMQWFSPTTLNPTQYNHSVEMSATTGPAVPRVCANGNVCRPGADIAMEGYLTKRVKSKKEFLKDPWERRYFVLNFRGEFYYYKNRQVYRSDPVNGREEKRPIELDEYVVKYFNSESTIRYQQQRGASPDFAIDSSGGNNSLGNTMSQSHSDDVSERGSSDDGDVISSTINHTTTTATSKPRMTIVNSIKHTMSSTHAIFQFKLVPLTGMEVLRHYGLRCDTEEEFTLWLDAMQSVSIANFEESYYSDK